MTPAVLIGVAQFGQLGASIRASVALIMDSPPSIGLVSGLQVFVLSPFGLPRSDHRRAPGSSP